MAPVNASLALARLATAFLEKMLVAVGVAAASVLVALLVRSAARRWLRPLLPHHVYKPIENVVFYAVLGIGVASALAPFGVDISILLVTGGVAGIVIGIASQTVVSNLLGGVFLLVERPFQIGDPVELNGVEGVVIDVNAFSTVIRTWDGRVVRVPNEKAFNSVLSNLAKTAARRLDLAVGISYGSDVETAREAVLRVIDDYPYCLVRPPPEVFVEEFADSAIVLRIRCWTPSVTWFEARRELLERVLREFRRVGVEIPFPQLDLHVKDLPPGLAEALSTGQQAGYVGAEGVGEAGAEG